MSKKRFLEGLKNKFVNSTKLAVFFNRQKQICLLLIKDWITFVGKLNKAKGYDVFAESIKNFNKFQIWKQNNYDEREKIELNHKGADLLGFRNHNEVLNIFKKSSIAVACSRWEEPFEELA